MYVAPCTGTIFCKMQRLSAECWHLPRQLHRFFHRLLLREEQLARAAMMYSWRRQVDQTLQMLDIMLSTLRVRKCGHVAWPYQRRLFRDRIALRLLADSLSQWNNPDDGLSTEEEEEEEEEDEDEEEEEDMDEPPMPVPDEEHEDEY